MTPDALHYALMTASWVAVPALVFAAAVLHWRVRSRWSGLLAVGLVAVLAGQAIQLFSPIQGLGYESFRGIVVSSGELPLAWHAGSLVAAAGLLIAAVGALGLAFTTPRSR